METRKVGLMCHAAFTPSSDGSMNYSIESDPVDSSWDHLVELVMAGHMQKTGDQTFTVTDQGKIYLGL